MNICIFEGNLVRDLEVSTFGENKIVAKGVLAVPDFSSRNKEPDFIRFEAFGDRGAYLAEKAGKGNSISISGRLKVGSYETKEGKRDYHILKVNDYKIHTWKNTENKDIFNGVEVEEDNPFENK